MIFSKEIFKANTRLEVSRLCTAVSGSGPFIYGLVISMCSGLVLELPFPTESLTITLELVGRL